METNVRWSGAVRSKNVSCQDVERVMVPLIHKKWNGIRWKFSDFHTTDCNEANVAPTITLRAETRNPPSSPFCNMYTRFAVDYYSARLFLLCPWALEVPFFILRRPLKVKPLPILLAQSILNESSYVGAGFCVHLISNNLNASLIHRLQYEWCATARSCLSAYFKRWSIDSVLPRYKSVLILSRWLRV